MENDEDVDVEEEVAELGADEDEDEILPEDNDEQRPGTGPDIGGVIPPPLPTSRCSGKNIFQQTVLEGKPRIREAASDEDTAVIGAAVEALMMANEMETIPDLYTKGGVMVQLAWTDDCYPLVEPVTKDSLRYIIGRAATFYKLTRRENEDGGFVMVEVNKPGPRAGVVNGIWSLRDLNFPVLRTVARVPGMLTDGSVQQEQGFDPKSGRLFVHLATDKWRRVSESPGEEEVKEARRLIEECLSGFPFVDDASRANAWAMLMTPLLRSYIKGQLMLIGVSASMAGSGKSLLCGLPQIISGYDSMIGKHVDVSDKNEFRKTMESAALGNRPVLVLDNMTEAINDPTLCELITSPVTEFRQMGAHKDVEVKNERLIIVNGNHLAIAGDMVRRACMVVIDAKCADPTAREDFTWSLPEEAVERRADLVWAVLTLARGWIAAGEPGPDSESSYLGFGKGSLSPTRPVISKAENFGDWGRVCGGILHWIDLPGFMENRRAIQGEDSNLAQWSAFVQTIGEYLAGQNKEGMEFMARDIAKNMVEKSEFGNVHIFNNELVDTAPASLGELDKGNLPRRIGNQFIDWAEVRFSDSPWYLQKAGLFRGTQKWAVVRATE